MLIIELIYTKPLLQVDEFLEPHLEFLDRYYASGVFIASGPKVPRDGGIILALTDRKTMEKIIQEDPFYKEGVAKYRIIQFEPKKHNRKFGELLSKILR